MNAFLVTGGAGFIGSHIVELLVRRGAEVRVLDNYLTGKRANIEPFLKRIEVIEGDIRDIDACRKAAEGVDSVLHQAALTSVPGSVEDPLPTNDVNINGTLNMLMAARDCGVRSFVLASSSAVYGNDPELPKKEEQNCDPLSPYGLSKWVGERYCRAFWSLYGLRTVALRYFNVFGPRQDPLSQYAAVIPRFIAAALRGERPVVFGDGEQSRDFIYVENVAAANILAAEAVDVPGGVFNIAGGRGTTVNELAARINAVLKTNLAPVYSPERMGDIKHSRADISAARERLGFEPIVPFEEGLERTVRRFEEWS